MEAYHYKGIDGATAYLAGVIQVLTTELSVVIGEVLPYYTVDADIYYIGTKHRLSFLPAIKDSLLNNWCGGMLPSENVDVSKEVEALDFEYERVEQSLENVILGAEKLFEVIDWKYLSKSQKERIRAAIKKYWCDLEYFTGNATAIYKVTKRNNIKAITRCYLSITISMYLIEFKENVMLFCFGSDE